MTLARDLAARVDSGTNLADILSSALPPDKRDSAMGQETSKREEKSSDSSVSTLMMIMLHTCSETLFDVLISFMFSLHRNMSQLYWYFNVRNVTDNFLSFEVVVYVHKHSKEKTKLNSRGF